LSRGASDGAKSGPAQPRGRRCAEPSHIVLTFTHQTVGTSVCTRLQLLERVGDAGAHPAILLKPMRTKSTDSCFGWIANDLYHEIGVKGCEVDEKELECFSSSPLPQDVVH
jgi:hypothetical protein